MKCRREGKGRLEKQPYGFAHCRPLVTWTEWFWWMVQWKPNGKSLKRKCGDGLQEFTELLNKQLYISASSSLDSKNMNLGTMVTVFALPLGSLSIWRCRPFPWFNHYQCFSSSSSFQKAVLQLGCDHSACQCTSGPEVISRWCVGICTSLIYLKLGPG